MLSARGLLRPSSWVTLRRTLFTEEYMGVSMLIKAQDVQLAATMDASAERSKVQKTATASPTLLLSDDVKLMINTSTDLKKVDETSAVLKAFIERADAKLILQNFTYQKMAQELIKKYFQLCHLHGAVHQARDFFDSAKSLLMHTILSKQHPGVTSHVLVSYLDLLFINNIYEETISVYDSISAEMEQAPRDLLTLATASCLKLNTPQSYETSTRLIRHAKEKGAHIFGRPTFAHGLLECNQGFPSQAFEEVNLSRDSVIKCNLVVHILVKMGRASDAVRYLERVFRSATDQPSQLRRKILISLEVVKDLTAAVEGADDETKRQLATLFSRFDEIAHINNMSLEDIVLKPIEMKKRLSDSRPRHRDQSRPRRNESLA